METDKSNYDEALEIITGDKKRYRLLLELGFAKAVLKSAVFAVVATPVVFFRVFILMASSSTPFEVTPSLQPVVSVVVAVLAFGYGLIWASPRSFVEAEIEKKRVAIFAKNMALASIKTQ